MSVHSSGEKGLPEMVQVYRLTGFPVVLRNVIFPGGKEMIYLSLTSQGLFV